MIKSYVPRFLYVPHSHQNLRPGDTPANIPNLMKHIISTALAVLALFKPPANAAAQKRIVINSEPAGTEVYVNGIPTNQQTPAMLKNPGGKAFSVGFGKKGYEDGKLLVVKQKQFDGKKAYPTEVSYRLTPPPTRRTRPSAKGRPNRRSAATIREQPPSNRRASAGRSTPTRKAHTCSTACCRAFPPW